MADVQITTPILDAQGQLATPSVLSQIDARADARVKVRVPDSGTAGQVLQRTATGTAWAPAPTSLPPGGTSGQTIVKQPDGSTAWANGTPGPQGPVGPVGPAGATGPQGPQGAASTVPGPKGDTGPAGPAGAQGTKGDPGVKGDVGPAGGPIPAGGTPGQYPTPLTGGGYGWADAPKGGSALVLSGPGRPDVPTTTGGIITGSELVGAEYRSTDGAGVGAYVWTKRPGGAWAVTDGDTGPRSLKAILPAAVSFSSVKHDFVVRRVGATVLLVATFRLNTDYLDAAQGPVLWTQTAGFRIQSPAYLPLSSSVTWNAGVIYVADGGQYNHIRAAGKGSTTLTISAQWPTPDPWPSAPLPGDPA